MGRAVFDGQKNLGFLQKNKKVPDFMSIMSNSACSPFLLNLYQTPKNGIKFHFIIIFTREYTKYTAGFTFCFVVVVVAAVGMEPLIKIGTISTNI
jgi:hypothetical protein